MERGGVRGALRGLVLRFWHCVPGGLVVGWWAGGPGGGRGATAPGAGDRAALQAQLFQQEPWVAGVGREGGRPRTLQALQVEEERKKHDGQGERMFRDRGVHVTASPSEMRISRAIKMKLAKMLDPP